MRDSLLSTVRRHGRKHQEYAKRNIQELQCTHSDINEVPGWITRVGDFRRCTEIWCGVRKSKCFNAKTFQCIVHTPNIPCGRGYSAPLASNHFPPSNSSIPVQGIGRIGGKEGLGCGLPAIQLAVSHQIEGCGLYEIRLSTLEAAGSGATRPCFSWVTHEGGFQVFNAGWLGIEEDDEIRCGGHGHSAPSSQRIRCGGHGDSDPPSQRVHKP